MVCSIANSVKNNNLDTLKLVLNHPSFACFARSAYTSPYGYSIRVNPFTKELEMFIAGTRDFFDWVLNTYDAIHHSMFDAPRVATVLHFERVVRGRNVQVVYGHSRGAAIVSDLNVNVTKIGLNSAMVLASDKSMLNINEWGTGSRFSSFDGFLSITGQNNVSMDFSPEHPHKVWLI